ncbi:hypothetical protein XENTR_v10009341 [Xenopus tropicalis]|nr:hypothetical protein XENTR_v10009341 [Xenopus tropicalis]
MYSLPMGIYFNLLYGPVFFCIQCLFLWSTDPRGRIKSINFQYRLGYEAMGLLYKVKASNTISVSPQACFRKALHPLSITGGTGMESACLEHILPVYNYLIGCPIERSDRTLLILNLVMHSLYTLYIIISMCTNIGEVEPNTSMIQHFSK